MATRSISKRQSAEHTRLWEQARTRLAWLGAQAKQAQTLDPFNDNLLDLIDSMDNDLQEVIKLVNRVRRGPEVNA